MNYQEAKEILRLYRPGTADVQDPAFATALEFARHDEELAQWLKNHHARHAAIRNQFKQIAIPAGLKEQILAEQNPRSAMANADARSRRGDEADDRNARENSSSHVDDDRSEISSNIIRKNFSWWRKPVFLRAAAVFVLLLGIAAIWFQQSGKNDYSQYRVRMVSTALRTYAMDLETSDLNRIQRFLAERNAPSEYTLPDELKRLEATGCVVVRWQNNPISMICFRTGQPLRPGEKSDLFLFVADRATFSNHASIGSPDIEKINRLTTASWVHGDKVFLLAAPGDEESLRKFL